jgi:hypothetical protein
MIRTRRVCGRNVVAKKVANEVAKNGKRKSQEKIPRAAIAQKKSG